MSIVTERIDGLLRIYSDRNKMLRDFISVIVLSVVKAQYMMRIIWTFHMLIQMEE